AAVVVLHVVRLAIRSPEPGRLALLALLPVARPAFARRRDEEQARREGQRRQRHGQQGQQFQTTGLMGSNRQSNHV
ncbi:MAG: hypothetical protein ACF8NJ_05900, partial [Phycisphaerales bacterium JB038]